MRALICTVVVLAGCAKSREQETSAESKRDIAKATVTEFAYEAYPSWTAAHPDKACPDRLEDLTEYMNTKDIKDPWGGTYTMLCGRTLPAGAKGIAVVSAGADRTAGTRDDVRSW